MKVDILSEDYIKFVKYMTIGARLCNFGFTDEQVHLLVALYEAVSQKSGELNLHDVVEIKISVAKQYAVKQIPEG